MSFLLSIKNNPFQFGEVFVPPKIVRSLVKNFLSLANFRLYHSKEFSASSLHFSKEKKSVGVSRCPIQFLFSIVVEVNLLKFIKAKKTLFGDQFSLLTVYSKLILIIPVQIEI